MSRPIRLRLPATSANLGPGFDTLGLAMNFHLTVEAQVASSTTLTVTGRDAGAIADADSNLVLSTYREVLLTTGRPVPELAVTLHNEIPLGMGCGSSAAALVAGVALANWAGELGWGAQEVLTEASLREGHPDNVAACVLGGLTASAIRGNTVDAVSLTPPASWRLLLVLPKTTLATSVARGLLPGSYSRADAVANLQHVALLTAAFATGRDDLLRHAMEDRLHQPYRAAVCPLLEKLLPIAGNLDVLGVALSGAGPSVLLLVRECAERQRVEAAVWKALGAHPGTAAGAEELVWTAVAGAADLG